MLSHYLNFYLNLTFCFCNLFLEYSYITSPSLTSFKPLPYLSPPLFTLVTYFNYYCYYYHYYYYTIKLILTNNCSFSPSPKKRELLHWNHWSGEAQKISIQITAFLNEDRIENKLLLFMNGLPLTVRTVYISNKTIAADLVNTFVSWKEQRRKAFRKRNPGSLMLRFNVKIQIIMIQLHEIIIIIITNQ